MESIIQVAVPRPLHTVYDYQVPSGVPTPRVGARVRVPFGPSQAIGVCTSTAVESPHAKLKYITCVLDDVPLVPNELMQLANWMSRYYHYPVGEILATILPVAARKGALGQVDAPDYWQVSQDSFDNPRAKVQAALFAYLHTNGPQSGTDLVAAGYKRATLRLLHNTDFVVRAQAPVGSEFDTPPVPGESQAQAIESICTNLNQYQTFLLEGVTGSGKTEVYMQVMQALFDQQSNTQKDAQQKQVLILVPEIALTPQTLARFKRRFDKVDTFHSNMTDKERLQVWLKCRNGETQVLVGTRSAVFTPFADLGLVVVDEEHDSSYKQQEGLRYSARDLAAKRCLGLNIPLILGSATPSLESLHNVELQRYTKLSLPHRAAGAQMPSYHIIDLRGQSPHDGISTPLQHVIRRHLADHAQVLVFLNRRGFAPTLLCTSCGWQAVCADCDARLTLHKNPNHLRCHHCGLRYPTPEQCGKCGHLSLLGIGLGTQRTEASLQQLFPDHPVYRIDRDTIRSSRALDAQLAKINTGEPAIMVGTQMLAKGHHFPNVTLVAILNADAGFCSPDFRAPERTAQLIVQVAGRSGRAERPGEVWIQSYQPDNPMLVNLIQHGYPGFAKVELEQRASMGLPPIAQMALIRAEAPVVSDAQQFLSSIKQQLHGVQCLGPVPAPLPRIANRLRQQLLLLADNRARLHQSLDRVETPKHKRDLRWSLDIDPYDSL